MDNRRKTERKNPMIKNNIFTIKTQWTSKHWYSNTSKGPSIFVYLTRLIYLNWFSMHTMFFLIYFCFIHCCTSLKSVNKLQMCSIFSTCLFCKNSIFCNFRSPLNPLSPFLKILNIIFIPPRLIFFHTTSRCHLAVSSSTHLPPILLTQVQLRVLPLQNC